MTSAVTAALRLGSLALAATALLGMVHALTRERIEQRQHEAERAALALVLPLALHDNDPSTDTIRVHAPRWLGAEQPLRVWRARRGATATALVLEAEAPDGYAGAIRLLIGVDLHGRLMGVRVTAHRETPGLGDPIDAARSDWIHGFTGRGLGDPPEARWAVRRDGGDFDQFAGATVTPRAVVAAVKRSLQYVQRHGEALRAAPTDSLLEHDDGPGA